MSPGEGRFSLHLRVPLAQVSLHSFSKFVFRPGKKKVSYTTKPFVQSLVWGLYSTKIPTGPTGKSGPPQKVDPLFRNFSGWTEPIFGFILLHEKFLQFDWLRAVVFQLNLKYLHVKITNLLWVVV